MRHRNIGRIIAPLVMVVALVVVGWNAEAEVRTLTDRHNNYFTTVFLFQDTQTFSANGQNIWTPVGRTPRRGATLNPNGDIIGDLWPTIAETEMGPYYAWAVWSRPVNFDYELVWARWANGSWGGTAEVFPQAPVAGDDLDPDVAFDSSGRPYLVWWRDENGQGRVYLSMFLVTLWSQTYPVSAPDVDGRYPSVQIEQDGEILVVFETPSGWVEQTILFNEPVTITDDIDPLDYMSSGNLRYLGEAP